MGLERTAVVRLWRWHRWRFVDLAGNWPERYAVPSHLDDRRALYVDTDQRRERLRVDDPYGRDSGLVNTHRRPLRRTLHRPVCRLDRVGVDELYSVERVVSDGSELVAQRVADRAENPDVRFLVRLHKPRGELPEATPVELADARHATRSIERDDLQVVGNSLPRLR